MSDAVPVEREIKIPVADRDAVRAALVRAGAELVGPAGREVNLLFDDDAGSMAGSGRVLRLRHSGGRWLVTLKGPAAYRGAIKEREELETGVDDGDVLQAVFERLGLRPLVRYEKDRETWRLGGVEVALDHTPMGDFVELEGPAGALEAAARALGLDPGSAVRGSYVGLWRAYREAHPGLDLPDDMVFER